VNGLLTYSAPRVDRFHVAAGTDAVALTIRYGKDIDPQTFRVEPQDDKLRTLFNPKKDHVETVSLPVSLGKNLITLSVQREVSAPRRASSADPAPPGHVGPEQDIDVFEIRVDAPRAQRQK
jgi:hypothetical protein